MYKSQYDRARVKETVVLSKREEDKEKEKDNEFILKFFINYKDNN